MFFIPRPCVKIFSDYYVVAPIQIISFFFVVRVCDKVLNLGDLLICNVTLVLNDAGALARSLKIK